MQKADNVFEALHKLGEKQMPVTRIYRQMYNPAMYLGAYAKIYANRGSMTRGSDRETVDGMSQHRIDRIIGKMRTERYDWKPARRVEIPKKSGGYRPLGIPSFEDRLVQEVLRAMLTAYYEPQFSRNSHGFRPEKGCHTALAQVASQFTGTKWFIEGDIKGCFDNINHTILMNILREKIQDQRILNLIKNSLEAGVMKEWKYERTYSGTPQGGILSPLLSNIYLDKLDKFVETVLIPKWTKGKRRGKNKAYTQTSYQIEKARCEGKKQEVKRLKQIQKTIPSQNPHDPNYSRLWYVRYADDYLLGFVGSRKEAEEIKAELADFLARELQLQQNPEKTLITHATTQQAHFLGYAISVYHSDEKESIGATARVKRRCANGRIRLGIPSRYVEKAINGYKKGHVIEGQVSFTPLSIPEILQRYQEKYRGIAEYYKFAVDRSRLSGLKAVMEEQMVKTLAQKLKISVSKVYRKMEAIKVIDGKPYKILLKTVETERREYRFEWGGIPLNHIKPGREIINDSKPTPKWSTGGELTQRLQARKCELCGSTESIEVHYIRKMAELKKRWANRTEKPYWIQVMIARARKTLVVCQKCHQDIHQGQMKSKV